jgi:hypothetical protein
MTPNTQAEYRSLAAHFYATRIEGTPSPKAITDALKKAAVEYRPAYWRRLRNALAFDQSQKGYQDAAARLSATKNPVTLPDSGVEAKTKQKRIQSVSARDEVALLDHLRKAEDRPAYGAIILAKLTGARPAEMPGIKVDGCRVLIRGAKKTADGLRGADRVLIVSEKEAQMIAACVDHVANSPMGAIQDRVRAAGKRLWPQRSAVPSLYSWRHQMGSELKAAIADRREVAYLMGHQGTASVDRYGNRRTARGGKVPRAPAEETFENVRETHSEPPTAKVPMGDLARAGELLRAHEHAENVRLSNEKRPERQGLGQEMSLNR